MPRACAIRTMSAIGLIVPSALRHVRHRHDPRALGQQRIELVDQQLAAIVHRQHAQPGAALLADDLPGNDVRVMLHCGDDHFVAWLKRRPDEGVRPRG